MSRLLRGLFLCSAAALLLTPPTSGLAQQAPESQEAGPAIAPAPSPDEPEQVLVTGFRQELIGTALTSSQGIVSKAQLQEVPVYRVGQLLETVPGLVVTSHSGEGKANQYLLRGFNLDHGTDLATFIDGMPINMRTHAHGQGYTDLNFFIPELATDLSYTKGPYFADEGDFGSVGSVHIGYLDDIADQASATVGSLGYERLFGAGTRDAAGGKLLGAFEIVHYDGPWTHSDNVRKANAVLRYSQGEASEGKSLTLMYYRGLWNATTDQPERAIAAGLIDRFGTLDPSDAGQAQRISLSGVYSHGTLDWHVDANAYVIDSDLTLWNDFTHFLHDRVHGDQHAQNDTRTIAGGGVSYTRYGENIGLNSETLAGIQGRYDWIHVDLLHTQNRMPLGVIEDDRVREGNVGIYLQQTDYWTEWLRTVVGVREDLFNARDRGTNAVDTSANVFQPKGSLIVTPWTGWEFYVSAGRGFHSNDIRGIFGGGTFLVASRGEEAGFRATPIKDLSATVSLFQMEFNSELTYDPDAGATSAGRPSRRTGLEINAHYTPFEWLDIYAGADFVHSRYTDFDPAGRFIPDAPSATGQFGIFVHDIAGWSGGLQFRYLGEHPLVEDNSVRSKGLQEWNANIGHEFGDGLKAEFGIFNLFDSKDNAAEYYYVDRLPGEPATGVADIHIHPLEPRAFRLTLSKTF